MHNVQNAMFAAALAYNMNVGLEDIRHGLRTFDATFFQAPGRMNIYDEHPFRVMLDYAHNPAAVSAICDVTDRFDVDGQRVKCWRASCVDAAAAAPGTVISADKNGIVVACAEAPLGMAKHLSAPFGVVRSSNR